jgi:amino acid transporter
MMDLLAILLVLVYNIILLGGTAYLVQTYDWSPWWFLLTVLLCVSGKLKDKK